MNPFESINQSQYTTRNNDEAPTTSTASSEEIGQLAGRNLSLEGIENDALIKEKSAEILSQPDDFPQSQDNGLEPHFKAGPKLHEPQVESVRESHFPNLSNFTPLIKRIQSAQNASEIISICDEEINVFKGEHIAAVCQYLVKHQNSIDLEQIRNMLQRLARQAINTISTFYPRFLANTASAFAELGFLHEELFESIAKQVRGESLIEICNLMDIAWAFEVVKYNPGDFRQWIIHQIKGSTRSSPQDIGKVAKILTKLDQLDRKFYYVLESEFMKKLEKADKTARDDLNFAFTAIRKLEESLIENLTIEITDSPHSAQPNVENVKERPAEKRQKTQSKQELSAENNARILSAENASDLINICKDAAQSFTPENIAAACTRLSKLPHNAGSEETLNALNLLASMAIKTISDFEPQHIAETAQALSKLTIRDNALCDALVKQARLKSSNFVPKAIVDTIEAFENLGIADRELFNNLILNKPRYVVENLAPQEVVYLMEVSVKYGIRGHIFLVSVASKVLGQFKNYDPQQLSSIATAFREHKYRHANLLERLATYVRTNITGLTTQQIVDLTSFFGTFNYKEKRLFDEIIPVVIDRITELNRRQISDITLAFANVQFIDKELGDALAKQYEIHTE